MEANEFKIKYENKSDWIHIEPIPDWHIGHANRDEEKEATVLNRIRDDPNRYTILIGDIADCIVPDDKKRFDWESLDERYNTPDKQYQYAFEKLRPIARKIIGIHTGNHDDILRQRHYHDWVRQLADDLRKSTGAAVPYLGWMAFTRLTCRYAKTGKGNNEHIYTIFSAHGGYAGLKTGGNLNSIEELTSSFAADIYLTGHSHQIVTSKKNLLGINKNLQLVERTKIFGVVGSLLTSYTLGRASYPEAKVKRPTRCGTITVSIQPETGRMDVHE